MFVCSKGTHDGSLVGFKDSTLTCFLVFYDVLYAVMDMPAEFSFLVEAENDGKLPVFPGELVRGMFLDAIESKYPKLAKFLHDYPKVKPYAIKPLAPMRGQKRVKGRSWIIKKGETFKLSFAILIDDLIDKVEQVLLNLDSFILADVKFSVVEPPNIKKQLYKYFKVKSVGAFLLDFKTPVAFKAMEEKYINPFPEPERIIRSITKIYSAFSGEEEPVKLPDGLEVAGYEVKTREIYSMGLKFLGIEGWVLYRVLGNSNELSKLLQLAYYSNLGIRRTLGLGVVKVRMFEKYNKKLVRKLLSKGKKEKGKKNKIKRPENPVRILEDAGKKFDLIKVTISKENEKIRFSECMNIKNMLNINAPVWLKNGDIVIHLYDKDELMKLLANINLNLEQLSQYKFTVTNVEIRRPNITGNKIRVYFLSPIKLKSGFPSVKALFEPIFKRVNKEVDVKNNIFVKMANLVADSRGFQGVVEYIFSDELLRSDMIAEAIVDMIINGIGQDYNGCMGALEIEVI